jgi:hypothetical protein
MGAAKDPSGCLILGEKCGFSGAGKGRQKYREWGMGVNEAGRVGRVDGVLTRRARRREGAEAFRRWEFGVFVDVYHGFWGKRWVFAVVCQGCVGFSSMFAKVLRF